MDNMLKVVLDMDAAARERTNEVKTMKEESLSKLSARKAEVKEEIMAEAKERAEKYAAEISAETDKKIEEIRQSGEASLKDMEALAKENREGWIDEIVKRALAQ